MDRGFGFGVLCAPAHRKGRGFMSR